MGGRRAAGRRAQRRAPADDQGWLARRRPDGRDLARLPGDAWVSFVVRDGQLVAIRKDTILRPRDDVLVLAPPDLHEKLTTIFEERAAK